MATTTTTIHAAAATESTYVMHNGVAGTPAAPLGTAFDRDTVAHDGVEHEILAAHIPLWSGARPAPALAAHLDAVDTRDQLRAELAILRLRMGMLARVQEEEMAELKAELKAEQTAELTAEPTAK